MNWLIVILIVAAIAGLIGYFSSDKNKGENAAKGAIMGGLGCGYIILQIFIFLVGIGILFAIGSWLFG